MCGICVKIMSPALSLRVCVLKENIEGFAWTPNTTHIPELSETDTFNPDNYGKSQNTSAMDHVLPATTESESMEQQPIAKATENATKLVHSPSSLFFWIKISEKLLSNTPCSK